MMGSPPGAYPTRARFKANPMLTKHRNTSPDDSSKYAFVAGFPVTIDVVENLDTERPNEVLVFVYVGDVLVTVCAADSDDEFSEDVYVSAEQGWDTDERWEQGKSWNKTIKAKESQNNYESDYLLHPSRRSRRLSDR
jgi:hypothetical protein